MVYGEETWGREMPERKLGTVQRLSDKSADGGAEERHEGEESEQKVQR